MIIEIPDENSIIKWKYNDKDEWKTAEISELIKAYELYARPKGEWVDKGEDMMIRWKCSECGRNDNHIYNFCPNCGADMRREE